METTKPTIKVKSTPSNGSRQLSDLMKWALWVVTLLFVTFFAGSLNLYLQFSGEVAGLMANSVDISAQKFSYQQLKGLPEPVQLYFRHVLSPGQSYIGNVHLRHGGLFKSDLKKGWVTISGEEYFSAKRPGFVWKGKTAMFTARDMFINGKGRLVVSLFSLFKIQDSYGKKYNRGELMRWLGESVCFPTNLLPSQNLKWFPIDAHSARLEYNYLGISINYMVIFNSRHEIVEMSAMRSMGEGPRQKWINRLSDYELRDGVRIPTVLEAGWQINGRYYPYARFKITEIEYNTPI